MLLALIGYRGSGKSAVAQLAAMRLGWDWVDADTTLLMIPSAGHFVQFDAPKLVNRTIRDSSPRAADRAPADPASARIMSHGGLPMTASNPAAVRRWPSRSNR